MAGSDDRPGSEFTLMEKLTVLAGHSNAGRTSFNVSDVAQEAFDEIEALRAKVERYEATLRIIAGSSDLIHATQAKGALTNIGAKV